MDDDHGGKLVYMRVRDAASGDRVSCCGKMTYIDDVYFADANGARLPTPCGAAPQT